jgi:hypothetical protein
MNVAILKAIWGDQVGYAFVPRRNPKELDSKGKPLWDEGIAYKYPAEFDLIKKHLLESAKSGWDTYWCPLLFSKPKRIKENALPLTRLLWADLDPVDPVKLGGLKPSIAWKSSDERYQALWLLDGEYDTTEVETLNRALTYKIGADKGGWDVGQVLRIPGSPNFKYEPYQMGKVLWNEKRQVSMEKMQKALLVADKPTTPEAAKSDLDTLLSGWKIHKRTRDLLYADPREVEGEDRSERLWEIETSLLEAGMPILTVVEVIAVCTWNKFKGRRGERDQIYSEVLKADKHVKTKPGAREEDTEVTPEEEERRSTDWAVPFKDFTSKRIEKPEWLVEGIWQKGTYGMIAGEPKTYKSVQATDLALSVASGRPYLNTFPVRTHGAVLYVQEENNENTVQDRVFKVAASKGLLTSTKGGWQLPNDLPLYFSNNFGINLTETKSRELLEETIKQIRPVLLILDPLYMMLGTVDENSATEVGDVLRWLTHLRNAYGTSIMLCHHYNKGGSGSSGRGGQRVRGSSAFHAWVESAIYVKATTELYTVKLEREFRAFPTMPELTLKIGLGNPGDLAYNPEILSSEDLIRSKDDEGLDVKLEEICTLLSMRPYTEVELEEACKITSVQVSRALERLVDSGRVMRSAGSGGRGRKATYTLK